jgi:uncharacterized membrane protein YkvA (DUF1232 family)
LQLKRKMRALRDGLTEESRVYGLVLRDERTPWLARLLLGAAVAYALTPIDLIPDWIPVVGHLDDVVIVPLLVWFGRRLVPAGVVDECRAQVRASRDSSGDAAGGSYS